MEPWKAVFIVVVIQFSCSWNFVCAEIKQKEDKPSSGGGQCDTSLDCNLEGICVNEEAQDEDPSKGEDDEINGKCVCYSGRDGENCEKENKSTRREEVTYGLKRGGGIVHNRALKFDPQLKGTGLEPGEVEKANQKFLLFNPATARYVRLSDDSPKSGKERKNKYLVTEESYIGPARLFKLKSAGVDQYNIQALDEGGKKTVGYVYLSKITKGVLKKSNRVMVSEALGTGDEYKFSFDVNDDQKGVYKIKCKGMTLYGSVGGHNVKADERVDRLSTFEIWFQINLRAVSGIESTVVRTDKDLISESEDLDITRDAFPNDSYEDEKAILNKEAIKSKVLSEYVKATATGTAGVKSKFGNLGLSVSTEQSTTGQYTMTSVGKTVVELVVKARSKLCVEYAVRVRNTYSQDELEISFGGNKFKGYKLVEGKGKGDVTLAVKRVGLDEDCGKITTS